MVTEWVRKDFFDELMGVQANVCRMVRFLKKGGWGDTEGKWGPEEDFWRKN